MMRWVLIAALLTLPALAADAPQRIISAAPSITEMLYALGLGARVVGVTSFCHYPPEVREKPQIGSYLRPNTEVVLSMQPDLVVVLKEHGDLIAQFRSLGLNVLSLRHNDLDGIYVSLRELAVRTGREQRAESLISAMKASLAEVERRAKNLPRRRVMFLVGRSPGTIRDLVVVGRGSFLNELMTLAGGSNLFAETSAFYPKISREEVLARRPEVIIDMGDMGDTDGATEAHKRAIVSLWDQLPTLPAVEQRRVYAVAEDVFVVPGPRVTEAVERLFEMIHPEAKP